MWRNPRRAVPLGCLHVALSASLARDLGRGALQGSGLRTQRGHRGGRTDERTNRAERATVPRSDWPGYYIAAMTSAFKARLVRSVRQAVRAHRDDFPLREVRSHSYRSYRQRGRSFCRLSLLRRGYEPERTARATTASSVSSCGELARDARALSVVLDDLHPSRTGVGLCPLLMYSSC